MRTILMILVFFIAIASNPTYSQDKNDKNEPDERIEVNREYDEQGNLIRYDSIYSYSSSNSAMNRKDLDSIFATFFSGDRSSFFENPFGRDDFPFPDGFLDMDSIFKSRLQSRSFFDHFFENQQPNNDTIYLKKNN